GYCYSYSPDCLRGLAPNTLLRQYRAAFGGTAVPDPELSHAALSRTRTSAHGGALPIRVHSRGCRRPVGDASAPPGSSKPFELDIGQCTVESLGTGTPGLNSGSLKLFSIQHLWRNALRRGQTIGCPRPSV